MEARQNKNAAGTATEKDWPGIERALPPVATAAWEWLSRNDVTWARMDTPEQPMVVTIVLVLATPVDVERLKATLRERLWLPFARFRRRVVRERGRYAWVDDATLNLDAHVQRLRLPEPADQAILEARVGELASEPLDFDQPLWRCIVIENYGAGGAVVFRVHHCVADGVALLRVFLTLTDRTPDVQNITAQPGLEEQRNQARLAAKTAKTPQPARGWLERWRWGTALLAALLRQQFMLPDARTALRGRLNGRKRMAWSAPIPLSEITAIRRRLGGRVNDVMLTAVAGALGRYLWTRDEVRPALTVRLVVPVNLRPYEEGIQLGNKFAVVFPKLPLGVTDPIARLAAIQAQMGRIKASPEAAASLTMLNLVGWLPAWVERWALRLFGMRATAVMTNVPGPEEPLYLANAPVTRVLAWVPQITGIGIGICVLSYAGAMTVGVITDSGVIADPWELVAGFEAEMAELVARAKGN